MGVKFVFSLRIHNAWIHLHPERNACNLTSLEDNENDGIHTQSEYFHIGLESVCSQSIQFNPVWPGDKQFTPFEDGIKDKSIKKLNIISKFQGSSGMQAHREVSVRKC